VEKMGYDPDQSKDNKRLVGLGSTSLRAQISEFDKKNAYLGCSMWSG